MRLQTTPDLGSGSLEAVARILMRNGGTGDSISDAARSYGESHPIVSAVKAAVLPGTTSTWGALAAPVVTSFLERLREDVSFDAAVPLMLPVPPGLSRVVVTSVGVVGSSVGEGLSKPISRISLDVSNLEFRKTVAELVVSDELVREADARELWSGELRRGVGVATDTQFVAVLETGAPIIIGSGSFFTDTSAALDALKLGASSRVFVLGHAQTIKSLGLLTDSAGARVLPDIGLRGGVFADVVVRSTDGIPVPDTSGGKLIFFDATQFAGNAGSIQMHVAHQASVQIDDAPANPPNADVPLISLWQNNLAGLRVERSFVAHKLRSTAAVVVENASYGTVA